MTASLQEKKNMYYVVVNYKFEGKWKKKWIKTGIQVKKGNKREAKQFLEDYIERNRGTDDAIIASKPLLFSDFMLQWLSIIEVSVRKNTFNSYRLVIENDIVPYFKEKKILLKDLNHVHLQAYYSELLTRMSANSVLKRQANIHKALNYAVKTKMISSNCSELVELPKKNRYIGNYYTVEQINQILCILKGTTMEVPVTIAVVFGLRRSEILGLTWDSIDFNKNIITINRTAIEIKGTKGTHVEYIENTKNNSSMRSLPLNENMKTFFKKLYKRQMENKLFFGDEYIENNLIVKWDNGEPYKPNYLSYKFKELIQKSNTDLPIYRFHDIRHTCASMLLNFRYSIKDIQLWLGHSTINTTANIYAHMDISQKMEMSNMISSKVNIAL